MRLWTCTKFTGHYPVGAAAVVLAMDVAQAIELLERELQAIGLQQRVSLEDMVELNVATAQAVVLVDGDY